MANNMKNSKKNDVPLIVIGDFAWDVLIRTNSDLLPGGDTFGEVMFAAGGSAANTAVWARRCGLETCFIGKIGRDRFGKLAEDNLHWENVDAHWIRTEEHRTAAVAVWIDKKGERSMVSGQGADFYLLSSELPINLIKKTNHLHLTAWSLFTDPPRTAALLAINEARNNGATISLDPASFQMISSTGKDKCIQLFQEIKPDLFFPNYDEAKLISGEVEPEKIFLKLEKQLPQTKIILKLDASGALIRNGDVLLNIAAEHKFIIDATGAGDSFAGAFLYQYLQSQSLEKAAKFAVKVSGWVVNKIGARPTPDEDLHKILL
jgi:ribokinase